MKTYGLIGFPLSHSFSKKYFTEKFLRENIEGYEYELFPIEHAEDVLVLIQQNPSLCGLNVTIPHKVNILSYVNQLDVAAEKIGAVNCISIIKEKDDVLLKGFNTDAFGFEASLQPLLKPQHQKALIFGDGGAAKAVKYVLNKLSIDFLSVVRNPDQEGILYQDLTDQILKDHKLLINTTPLGMSPHIDTYPPVNYASLTPEHLAYDLVYNPLQTAFLTKAAVHGAEIKNGLEMLYKQAEKAWSIWNNLP